MHEIAECVSSRFTSANHPVCESRSPESFSTPLLPLLSLCFLVYVNRSKTFFGLRGRACWSNGTPDQWLWRDLTSLINVFHTEGTAEMKKFTSGANGHMFSLFRPKKPRRKKKTPLGIKFKNEERSRRVNSSRVFRLRVRAPEQRGVGARHELRVVSFDFLCRRSDFKEWPKTNQQPASLTCDGRSFKSTVKRGVSMTQKTSLCFSLVEWTQQRLDEKTSCSWGWSWNETSCH